MSARLVLVTGFGPFPGRPLNPSREIAASLELDPPRGLAVRASELPVTFEGAPIAVARFVERFVGERPALFLGLGVQPEASFRLERRARGQFDAARRDNEGRTGAAIDLGHELVTRCDLETLALHLRDAGARDVRISDDAGRYVCERTYRELLEQGERHGVPAVFLHVPPIESLASAEQARLVRAMLEKWGAS